MPVSACLRRLRERQQEVGAFRCGGCDLDALRSPALFLDNPSAFKIDNDFSQMEVRGIKPLNGGPSYEKGTILSASTVMISEILAEAIEVTAMLPHAGPAAALSLMGLHGGNGKFLYPELTMVLSAGVVVLTDRGRFLPQYGRSVHTEKSLHVIAVPLEKAHLHNGVYNFLLAEPVAA